MEADQQPSFQLRPPPPSAAPDWAAAGEQLATYVQDGLFKARWRLCVPAEQHAARIFAAAYAVVDDDGDLVEGVVTVAWKALLPNHPGWAHSWRHGDAQADWFPIQGAAHDYVTVLQEAEQSVEGLGAQFT